MRREKEKGRKDEENDRRKKERAKKSGMKNARLFRATRDDRKRGRPSSRRLRVMLPVPYEEADLEVAALDFGSGESNRGSSGARARFYSGALAVSPRNCRSAKLPLVRLVFEVTRSVT